MLPVIDALNTKNNTITARTINPMSLKILNFLLNIFSPLYSIKNNTINCQEFTFGKNSNFIIWSVFPSIFALSEISFSATTSTCFS